MNTQLITTQNAHDEAGRDRYNSPRLSRQTPHLDWLNERERDIVVSLTRLARLFLAFASTLFHAVQVMVTDRLKQESGYWAARIRIALVTALLSLSLFSISSMISPQQALASQCDGTPYTQGDTTHRGIFFDGDTGNCYTDSVSGYPAITNGFRAEIWNDQVSITRNPNFYGTFGVWESCSVVRDPGLPHSNTASSGLTCTTGPHGVVFYTDGTYDLEWTLTQSAVQGGNVYVVKVNISVVLGPSGSHTVNSMGIVGGNFLGGPPDITSNGGATNETASVAENQTVVTDVQSIDDSDSEGAGLTYSLTGGADQAKFNINASSGVLTFATAPDFENPTDVGTNNIYDVQVTVTDSDGLTDVQNLAVTVTDVVDETIPSVAILGAPDTTNGVTPFNITVQFSEDVATFIAGEITVGNGTVSNFTTVNASTYTADITPAGQLDITINVAANVVQDTAGNPNTAAAQVTVRGNVVEDTMKVIATFMQSRASHILANQPDISNFVSGSNKGGGGPLGNLQLNGNEDILTLSFATSRSKLMAQANRTAALALGARNGLEEAGLSDSVQPGRAGSYDIWTQVNGSRSNTSAADSSLWVGHFGAHYFVSNDVLVGAALQLDWADETNALPGSRADGNGWMFGPYIAGRVPGQSILYEVRASWGRSDNTVSPLGTYSDSFETERWLVSSKISGSYKLDDWTVSPEAGVSWFEEQQQAYSDSFSSLIPEQIVSLGEFKFGPNFTYDVKLEDGTTIQPSFGVLGVKNFGIKRGILTQGLALGTNDLRARLNAGITMTNSHNWNLALAGFYDGLGIDDYKLWGGNLQLKVPFH
jgi:Bacterial Ig-like domain/Autotransporter beta-domain/Cadherin domain